MLIDMTLTAAFRRVYHLLLALFCPREGELTLGGLQAAHSPTWRGGEGGDGGDGAEGLEFFFEDLEGNPVGEQDEELERFALGLAQVADGMKAESISVLDVSQCCSWCSFMVLVSVFSRPQLGAVLARLEESAQQEYGRPQQAETRPGKSEWEVLDFGDVVVHVMSPRQREFYDLESFYVDAVEVPLPPSAQREILAPPRL